MMRGIVLLGGADRQIEGKARSAGLPVTIGDGVGNEAAVPLPLPYDQCLIVERGTQVPWDLLPAAWKFLERWDAAAPLWRYGVLCEDLGDKPQRAEAREVVLDLRVPVYASELLFVNRAGDGGRLVAAWVRTCSGHGGRTAEKAPRTDSRLAFTRALCEVKPRFCVLPRSWLAKVMERSKRDARSRASIAREAVLPLVRVEVAPGRYIKCRMGEEEKTRARYQEGMARMEHRKKRARGG